LFISLLPEKKSRKKREENPQKKGKKYCLYSLLVSHRLPSPAKPNHFVPLPIHSVIIFSSGNNHPRSLHSQKKGKHKQLQFHGELGTLWLKVGSIANFQQASY
jgi:hypothetical protein